MKPVRFDVALTSGVARGPMRMPRGTRRHRRPQTRGTTVTSRKQREIESDKYKLFTYQNSCFKCAALVRPSDLSIGCNASRSLSICHEPSIWVAAQSFLPLCAHESVHYASLGVGLMVESTKSFHIYLVQQS